MNAQALVNSLECAGVVLKAQNDRLHIDAPKGVITPEIKKQLSAFKLEIIKTISIKKTPTKPKMRVYEVAVSDKKLTVLDSTGKSEEEMRISLLSRFGSSLDLKVVLT